MEHVVRLLLLLLGATLPEMFDAKSEKHMSTKEIIVYNGYPVETHKVHTDDGYILTMYRIPHGIRDDTKSRHNHTKGVFYLQHGLLGSSANFVTNLPRHSIAFTLVDAGYDVWLGNTRGNTYSTEHEFLSIDSDEFWDFSHDEMVKYDFPAMVNHVLKTSQQKQLYYVGHSQGTLIAFARLNEDKNLRKKIKGIFAMGPIARLRHVYRPIKIAAQVSYGLKVFIEQMHVKNPLPIIRALADINSNIHKIICMVKPKLCKTFPKLVQQIITNLKGNTSDLVRLSSIPDGTSVKNLFHYCQLLDSGKFQKYDYGLLGNLLWYASLKPPHYDLKNVDVPTVLFSGSKDILSVREDVEWIADQLPNVLHSIVIPEYSHLSFTWSRTANEKVYKKIVKIARTEMN